MPIVFLQVLVGCANGVVKTFSTEKGIFTETRECGDHTQGKFTGLAVTDRLVMNCVCMYNFNSKRFLSMLCDIPFTFVNSKAMDSDVHRRYYFIP